MNVGQKTLLLLLLLLTLTFSPPAGPQAPSLTEQVREGLRNRLESAEKLVVAREKIHTRVVLPEFYMRRMYRPAWTGERGPLPAADTLVKLLRAADQEGLRPGDYHLEKIESLLRSLREPASGAWRALVDLELLLTDAYLLCASHLLAGRVDPETVHPLWLANRRGADLADVLERALAGGQLRESLEGLKPPQPGYARLREALARYRELVEGGGWPQIPEGSKLEKDVREGRVRLLRERLRATGDLGAAPGPDDDIFDDMVEEAVRRFQRRHGMAVDGVVGPGTLAALNVPVERRLHQIELNLERWRWLPEELGERHILVNIPNFELDVFEKGAKVLHMRAIVGKHYRRTPVFSDRVAYFVLSPLWHVPTLIAVADLLPRQQKNPAYFKDNGFRVFSGWGAEARELDPTTIDWSQLSRKNFPYRLRQDPGPKNFLGGIKFMFPNKFNVYLHDTPDRELFEKPERGFSSGCIRIEKPLELALYLVQNDPRWSQEKLLAGIASRREQTVQLPARVPVHLLYWTAWADEQGRVHFRRDLYERDAQLDAALHTPPPRAQRLEIKATEGVGD